MKLTRFFRFSIDHWVKSADLISLRQGMDLLALCGEKMDGIHARMRNSFDVQDATELELGPNPCRCCVERANELAARAGATPTSAAPPGPPARLRAYYAHPQSLYGTPQEARDVELLVRLGFEVVNPRGEDSTDMEHYRGLVRTCDLVAFRNAPFAPGLLAGVAAEVKVAEEEGLPVIELPSRMGEVMSVEETRRYLAEVGQR